MQGIDIPEQIGAILLPDCTLFPHGALPLHIFEERYRDMLNEALEGNCLFAVGRLQGEETDDLSTCTAPVGTASLIRASRELPDGRSHLVLHGVFRVRFLEWLSGKSYPFARIEPVLTVPVPEDDAIKQSKRLRDAVEAVLTGFPDQVVEQVRALLDKATDPHIRADAIAQQFVHEPDLRQELLEEPSVAVRIDRVIAHLQSLRPGEN